MVEDDIKEQKIEEQIKSSEIIKRSDLTLQTFMDDMSALGAQVKQPTIDKPNFNYGDGSVTNYLLWLILGELMIMNDKENIEEEE